MDWVCSSDSFSTRSWVQRAFMLLAHAQSVKNRDRSRTNVWPFVVMGKRRMHVTAFNRLAGKGLTFSAWFMSSNLLHTPAPHFHVSFDCCLRRTRPACRLVERYAERSTSKTVEAQNSNSRAKAPEVAPIGTCSRKNLKACSKG